MSIAGLIVSKIFHKGKGTPEQRSKLVDAISKGIDGIWTSKNELAELELSLDLQESKDVTTRHTNDMTSDNKLSKNVRPAIALFCILLTAILMIWDSASKNFIISEEWLQLWKTTLSSIIVFYFGSRGAEKVVKMWARRPPK